MAESIVMLQRDASRIPVPGRYPSSKLVVWMLGRAGIIKPLQRLRILDLTYGQGIWWDSLRSAIVAGVDIARREWVRPPKCFFETTSWSWPRYESEILSCLGGPPDLVAVDPPWRDRKAGFEYQRGYGRDYYTVKYMVGSPESILRAGAEASRHWRVPLLAHYRDRWVPDGFRSVLEVWWYPETIPKVKETGYKTWWGILLPA